MRRKGQARENTAIQFIAALIPALSALPSAYFVARSSWYWLIDQWHVPLWPALGVSIAVIIGLVVEGLGTVSIFLALTFWRWNNIKAKKQGYDAAPFPLAVISVGIYIAATIILLAFLEAWGDKMGPYAPVIFPFLTIVGGLCWAMYDQHRDRLAEKGLSWNWVATTEQPRNVPEQPIQSFQIDGTQRAILELWRNDPGMSLEQAGNAVGVSKTTAHRKRLELEALGLLPPRNGNHA